MNWFMHKRSQKSALPPGTLMHVGERKTETTKITVIDYDENNFQERVAATVEECLPFKDTQTVTWINVDGLHDVEIISKLGDFFGLHPLILEDILNTGQRPKYEDFDDYIYIVLRMIYYGNGDDKIRSEQVSIVFGKNFVLSFQEKQGDVFDPIRDRIKNSKGRVRKMGTDYLAYCLLDSVVDSYFAILERLGEKVEDIEDDLVVHPSPETLQLLHGMKKDMIHLRKSVWPLREVINFLERGEARLIQKSTRLFLRDVYDHTIQVIDTIETLRDMIAGMLDIYLSSISNKMNEIMKVLTIIATIFIPITFIAGVYGMNFRYFPELEWKWGYFGALGIMAAVAIVMLVYFRRKKWL